MQIAGSVSNTASNIFTKIASLATLACVVWIYLLGGTAQAQTTTYSESFTAGVGNDPGSPQVDNWEAFRDGLTATYSRITVGGSEGPDISCSDPAAVAQIAANLNGDVTGTVSCDGRTWNTGVCVGTNSFSVDVPVCTCETASPFTLRPDVDAGDAAWGGIGGTCGPAVLGAGANVDQTLTVSVEALGAPTDADLSLTLSPSSNSPATGANTFIDVTISNAGPAAATGVTASFPLPSGLSFVLDDSGGSYNPATGVWSVGAIAAGTTERLRVVVQVLPVGSYSLAAQITASDQNDNDSTPGNAATNPAEDDSDAETLTPVPPPAPLFCLGRPITPLGFRNPTAETAGANPNNPQLGDVFRFGNVAPGFDALVRVDAFNNGASLLNIDNGVDGIADNFQPTLAGPAGDVSVDFEITLVTTGTNTPAQLDFSGAVIDVDGNSVGLREYVEVSDNIVEFALNDPTRLISQATTPPDPAATAPSAANRLRFESATPDTAPGIDPNEPQNIAAAFFTDVSVFEYRVGKLGDAIGAAGRLNSLAFNCPVISPSTTNPAADEDFGDAPISYGNPIHVIDPAVRLGATNTPDTAPGDSPTAASDAGDDGVTLPAAFGLGGTATVTVSVTGAGGFLQGFFDWNGDGDFDEAGEQAVINVTDVDADGSIPLSISVPGTAAVGTSFARFRWSTSAGVGIQDPAGDGEVEDYQITIVNAPDLELAFTPLSEPPIQGFATDIELVLTNAGAVASTGSTVSVPIPNGYQFVADDAGGNFDSATGIWTVGALAPGASITLTLTLAPLDGGTSLITAEVATANEGDTDSTPGNGVAAEDDFTTLDPAAIRGLGEPAPTLTCAAGFSILDWETLTGVWVNSAPDQTVTGSDGVPFRVQFTGDTTTADSFRSRAEQWLHGGACAS